MPNLTKYPARTTAAVCIVVGIVGACLGPPFDKGAVFVVIGILVTYILTRK